MNKELVAKLEKLVSDMDLPFYRKTIKSHDGLRWLVRNIGIRNLKHKNYESACEVLSQLLKK